MTSRLRRWWWTPRGPGDVVAAAWCAAVLVARAGGPYVVVFGLAVAGLAAGRVLERRVYLAAEMLRDAAPLCDAECPALGGLDVPGHPVHRCRRRDGHPGDEHPCRCGAEFVVTEEWHT